MDSQHRDTPTLVNNTIVDNDVYGVVGGLPTIVNCIVWGHLDDLGCAGEPGELLGRQRGGYDGVNHNISADPEFVDPSVGDYHLSPASPAIDAGDTSQPGLPATDIDGEARIMGVAVDMGADEFRQYAVFLPVITRTQDSPLVIDRPVEAGWRRYPRAHLRSAPQ